MKLLTKQNLKDLPGMYDTNDIPLDERKIHVKLFCAWSDWTWYLTEYDPNSGVFFGYVEGFESEWGYTSIRELADIRGPGGLTIERDKWFKACMFKDLKRKI